MTEKLLNIKNNPTGKFSNNNNDSKNVISNSSGKSTVKISKFDDVRRKEIITRHRKSLKQWQNGLYAFHHRSYSHMPITMTDKPSGTRWTTKPPRAQTMPKSLANLKSLLIDDIDLTVDKVHSGYPCNSIPHIIYVTHHTTPPPYIHAIYTVHSKCAFLITV